MKAYIGTSGYNYSSWNERFYPQKMNTKQMFQYYSEKFSTVEINYTFYHTPRETTLHNWFKVAPPDFKYTLKVPRKITHVRRLKDCEELIKEFNSLALILKEKCGVILFQMPPSFKFNKENFKRVEQSFKKLNKKLIYAIEFRHNSWFDSAEIKTLCRRHRVSFCAVSAPGIKFEPVETSDHFYLRLHGRDKWYDHDYSKKELREYAGILDQFIKKGKTVWVYFNNDVQARAPKNALLLKELMKA
ncbi:MAG: DUF72 domain-containing protein [Spirochaetes bacterium]|nr:DUF72 domain-containing protein [Spirochaetota bacterium]